MVRDSVITKEFNEVHLANAVMLWLSYISAIGREYVLNEGAIRFPVAEYLERSNVDGIELEFSHPKLFKKRFDLFFKNKNVKNVFEFKYIKNGSTRNTDEKQRVFNDLMRLHLYLEETNKGYFLICGDRRQFISNFQKMNPPPKDKIDGDKFLLKDTAEQKSIFEDSLGFYTEWFSFDYKKRDREIVLKAENEYKEFYETFENEYTKPFEEKTKEKLELPKKITTRLIYISPAIKETKGLPEPTKIGIWEIINNKDNS
jgi:hypothetical protein